jgi:hypothetical protein
MTGFTPDDPLPIVLSGTISGWDSVVDAVNAQGGADKYIVLDLSACTMSGGETSFDPDNTISTGKEKILSLVLPNTVTRVREGTLVIGENGSYDTTAAFEYFTFLKEVRGAAVTRIGNYAFSGCSYLATASFPEATSIGAEAFSGCQNLTTAPCPKATSIGEWAFAGCALTTASFPEVTSIGRGAFDDCEALTTASFPKVTFIGEDAFFYCTALTTASFPEATSIGGSAFDGCVALTTASFPKAISIGEEAFYETGTAALTVILPQAAPTVSMSGPGSETYSKTVTVRTPASPTGYDADWQAVFKRAFGGDAVINLIFETDTD